MNAPLPPRLDPDTQIMLNCLRLAVSRALERKRRLGQYAVVWDGNGPVAVGDDAPPTKKSARHDDTD
ncbi:MAG: hypothetical protein FIA96_01675 [Betaproteobacteria bacterium]|nr:hypothetical protein [Betaproteobacteria bacterium]